MSKLFGVDRDPTQRTVLLKGVRLSFADTLKEAKPPKKAEPGAKATHGCNLIIEQGSQHFEASQAAVIEALKNTCKEFKRPEMWWKSLWDNDPSKLAFRHGNKFTNDQTGEIYPGYEGNLVIVAKGPRAGANRPTLWDKYKRDVAFEDILDVMYNGTYCDAIVSWYATDSGGTARVTCSVEVLRSHQKGDRMGGGGIDVRQDDFDDMEDDDMDNFGAGAGGGASTQGSAGGDLLGTSGGSGGDLLGGGGSSQSSGTMDLLG